MRNVLVIIPTTKIDYYEGFSAPLAWLFTSYEDYVLGKYSYEVTKKDIQQFKYFIIELNWFTSLYEVILLISFIKENNRKSEIYLGGLYTQIKQEEILNRFLVDGIFYGDSELSIKQFIEGEKTENIYNLITKKYSFKRWIIKQEDLDKIDFSLEWFPTYKENFENKNFEGDTEDFSLPMIITGRNCTIRHKGCEYCLGSKKELLNEIYCRDDLALTNKQLNNLLQKAVDKKFRKISLYVMSDINEYTFDNYYDIELYAEIDSSPKSIDILKSMKKNFKKAIIQIPLYENGIMGGKIVENYEELFCLNNDKFSLWFMAYSNLKEKRKEVYELLQNRLIDRLDTVFAPEFANFSVYENIERAYNISKELYELQNFPKFERKEEVKKGFLWKS